MQIYLGSLTNNCIPSILVERSLAPIDKSLVSTLETSGSYHIDKGLGTQYGPAWLFSVVLLALGLFGAFLNCLLVQCGRQMAGTPAASIQGQFCYECVFELRQRTAATISRSTSHCQLHETLSYYKCIYELHLHYIYTYIFRTFKYSPSHLNHR